MSLRSLSLVLLSVTLVGTLACNDAPRQERAAASALGDGADGNACPARTYATLPYRGVSLSGAEWGSNYPGKEGLDYVWAKTSEIDFFLAKGMNTFRIGFQWERLQPQAYGGLAAEYLSNLDRLVTHATSRGARVVLNPHNFARYYEQVVGSPAVPNGVFADLWSRLAVRYAANPRVLFNLVNEPHDMPTEQWVSAANAAIAAIREAGATSTIIVPGNAWTGGASWGDDWYGTPNAIAMLAISDPSDNVLFEAHQYFDTDASGGSGTCVSPTIGSERIAGFVAWLRKNGKKGFIGEFAGGKNATCDAAVRDFLGFATSNADVLQGWMWWAGGPGWGDDYIFRLEPDSRGVDGPAWANLSPYLSGAAPCEPGGGDIPPPPPPPPPPPLPPPPPPPPNGGGDATYTASSESLTSNGVARRFVLAVPSAAVAEPLPLVIVLHWDGGSAESARRDGPQLEAQANGAAAFAYLQAPQGDTFPYWTAKGRGAEAVFVKDLIASLSQRGIARAGRVFITGVSGGATMTNAIMCVLGSAVLRAGVVMSGSFYAVDGNDLWATMPDGTEVRRCAETPAVQIQWGQDDTGDTDFVNAGKSTRDAYRTQLGCGATTQDAQPSPCVTYDGCSKPVGWCAIAGMGHAVWSSGAAAAWTFLSAAP